MEQGGMRFKNIFIAVGIIFFDQLSKFLAPRLGFKVVYNQGITFGLFPDLVWIVIVPLVLLLAVTLKRHFPPKYYILNTIYYIPLIVGGGISNFIDRLVFGSVRDWISLPFVPAFNLADLSISFGFLLLVYALICQPRP